LLGWLGRDSKAVEGTRNVESPGACEEGQGTVPVRVEWHFNESRVSTVTGPQRSTTPDSLPLLYRDSLAIRGSSSLEAKSLVKIDARIGERRLTQFGLGDRKFLPGLEALHIASDASGLQLRVLRRFMDPRNMP